LTDQSPIDSRLSSSRDDKLRAIAAVFGEEVAARLGPLPAPRAGDGPAPDPAAEQDRLAWQTNRLIRHLRHKVDTAAPKPEAPGGAMTPTSSRPDRPRALPRFEAGEDLAHEHPAVIAHMLRHEGQAIRVSVLRALPGQLARDVMRRLKGA
jgi:hypothetical protein